MNPLLSQALGSILRWALAFGAGWLVQHGVWTSADASTYVMAASLALLSLGLSLWNKYKTRLMLMTALTMPAGATEDQVKAKLASGAVVPTITTPPNTAPGIPKVVIPLLLALSLGLSACGPRPVTVVTPQGQAAYTSDQVSVRVNELMNTAITANGSQALDTNTTRTIVTWCVNADKTLAAVPLGWQQTLLTEWQAAKKTFPPPTNPAVAASIAAVDVVLGSL